MTLVDTLADEPIECINPEGHQDLPAGAGEFDVLIYATGFDWVTGAFDRIAILRHDNGLRLKDQLWTESPRTYLGMPRKVFPIC